MFGAPVLQDVLYGWHSALCVREAEVQVRVQTSPVPLSRDAWAGTSSPKAGGPWPAHTQQDRAHLERWGLVTLWAGSLCLRLPKANGPGPHTDASPELTPGWVGTLTVTCPGARPHSPGGGPSHGRHRKGQAGDCQSPWVSGRDQAARTVLCASGSGVLPRGPSSASLPAPAPGRDRLTLFQGRLVNLLRHEALETKGSHAGTPRRRLTSSPPQPATTAPR